MSAPAVYGHRGSRRPGPENTVAAVCAAFDAGADGVEVDVRRGPNGVLAVSHPPLSPGTVVTGLTQVLDAAAGRGRVVCEVKNRPGELDYDAPTAQTARDLVALLAGRGAGDDVVVSSFDWFSLAAVRALDGPPTAFLLPPGVALRAGVAHATEHGHAALHPHWAQVTARGVERVHASGLLLVAWTITSVGRARRLAGLGVDGLICDDPAAVAAALAG